MLAKIENANLKFVNFAESPIQITEEEEKDQPIKFCSCKQNSNGSDFTSWLRVYMDKETSRPCRDEEKAKKFSKKSSNWG